LLAGGVGVVPTDTVYGLVCRAADPNAVQRLFTVKKREANPGTVLAASIQQLIDLGLKGRYVKAVERFWPNSISVVIPCGEELAYLHQGKHSLAVRIPADPELRDFLKQTGALMTTSANHPGEPTAHTITGAQEYFGETVDFYVDAGDLGERPASTIIRVVDDAVEVLRQGALHIDESGRITDV
jgi:L-threonylcarbamoyladenylate synthase